MPPKEKGRKYFQIRSKMNGKVLDVEGGNDAEGTRVIMWEKNDPPTDNQLWFTNKNGIIKSKLNDFPLCFDGEQMCLRPMEKGNQNYRWIFKGKRICRHDDHDTCVDIRGSNDEDGADLVAYEFAGQDNQKWERDNV